MTKILHWLIFSLFLGQYATVLIKKYLLSADDPLKTILIKDWHKPMGTVLLVLGILSLIWHNVNIKPTWPKMQAWEQVLARLTHLGLFTLMIVFPATGFFMSAYAGYPVSFFGLFNIDLGLDLNKNLAGQLFGWHETCGYATLVVVGLHIAGALKHHFVYKDKVLKRMI
ncbi:MAG: cytochrome b [Gammaproteobacteria bacterium]